uniref:Uncharacterized protein n=1 Tax=Arundo donax TaxID=35708 RepID=A0A0A8ZCQ0_ARUDO
MTTSIIYKWCSETEAESMFNRRSSKSGQALIRHPGILHQDQNWLNNPSPGTATAFRSQFVIINA